MTLDDVETTACEFMCYASHFGALAEIHHGRWTSEQVTDLARAVLAMLPVVRAAESCYLDDTRERLPTELIEAIITLRSLVKAEP